MSTSLDPDQAQCFVDTDLSHTVCNGLSTDDKRHHQQGKSII